MKRHLAAAIVLTALLAPAAYAASDDQSSTSVQTIRPDQMRASKIIGSAVYDRNNQKIGSVQDLILDKAGRVNSMVVDVGSYLGLGGKDVAIPMSNIKTDNNRLTLDQTKAQLQQTASFQLEDSNTGAGQGPSPVTGGSVGTSTHVTQ